MPNSIQKCFKQWYNNDQTTERDEPFLDLGIDLEQNTSISYCIKNFSNAEVLKDDDKFHCDKCKGLHDAEKKYSFRKLKGYLMKLECL